MKIISTSGRRYSSGFIKKIFSERDEVILYFCPEDIDIGNITYWPTDVHITFWIEDIPHLRGSYWADICVQNGEVKIEKTYHIIQAQIFKKV